MAKGRVAIMVEDVFSDEIKIICFTEDSGLS